MTEMHREVIDAIGRKVCAEGCGVAAGTVGSWAHRDRIASAYWLTVADLSKGTDRLVTAQDLRDYAMAQRKRDRSAA